MDTSPGCIQNINPNTNRRTTRSALSELPPRLGVVNVPENSQLSATNVTGTTAPNMWGLADRFNIPDSYLSPSPSPDEMIIQQRGRRRVPVTWSPDIDHNKMFPSCGNDRTPVKGSSPSKCSIVLRSTPRKRLLLGGDSKDLTLTPTPDKLKKMSPNSKKSRVEKRASNFTGSLQTALKGLSQEQLVDIIQLMLEKHSIMEEEIRDILPVPDIRPLEEKLSYLKKNIFKSLPTSRLMSKTDSPAYNRAATHILAFKKCVVDQGRHLVESQHWDAVLDYVFLAWTYVRATPVWDHTPHNAARKQCFKFLAAQCLTALKKGVWTSEQCDEFEEKLERCSADSEEIQTCIKQLSIIRRK